MKNMTVRALAIGAIALATLSTAANAWCGTPWRRFPPPPPPDWRTHVILDDQLVQPNTLLVRPGANGLLVRPGANGLLVRPGANGLILGPGR
jgi:hypothetical protein